MNDFFFLPSNLPFPKANGQAAVVAAFAPKPKSPTTPVPQSQSTPTFSTTSRSSGSLISGGDKDKAVISAPSGFRSGPVPPELLLVKSLSRRTTAIDHSTSKELAAAAIAAEINSINSKKTPPGTLEKERPSSAASTSTPPSTLERKQPTPFMVADESLRHALQENEQLRAEVTRKEKELESLKAELAAQREANKKLHKR